METRETDYEHYVKCGECGWEGWAALMRLGYQAYGVGEQVDVEPMNFCPKCDTSELFAEVFITCHKNCNSCSDRFICFTVLNKIPMRC